ncbi:MAG: hypothetical protein WCI73_08280 [Phycisphaerae bacterium]
MSAAGVRPPIARVHGAALFQRGGCSKAQAAALIHARARLPLDWLGEPVRRSLAEQGAVLAHGGQPNSANSLVPCIEGIHRTLSFFFKPRAVFAEHVCK